MDYFEVLTNALNELVVDLVDLLPKILIALVIWYIGVFLLGLAVRLLKNIDIAKTDLDDKAVAIISTLINTVGRVLLALILLDYFGVGSTVVGAIANGLTFTIAIALGIAFGDALKPQAKRWVTQSMKFLTK